MDLLACYNESLRSIPPPGCGCHPYLLAVADYGVLAGLSGEQIFSDVRSAIPTGTRRIPDREIQDAISKSLSDRNGGTFTPRPRPEPIVRDGKATLQKIIDQGKISDESDLWEASPIRLLEESQGDPVLLLKTLFKPAELVFIGDRHEAGIIGDTIRTVQEWIAYLQDDGKAGPHVIPNPLTGTSTPKKTGDGETLRGDGNVAAYRYCMAEFDTLSREDQIRFWSAVKLPIVALIDSGRRSIHAWIDVQKLATVETSDQWETEIKGRLYDRLLTPLGVDGACSNPARLSRLPGHYREEKQAWQRLLWLSPEGRSINENI